MSQKKGGGKPSFPGSSSSPAKWKDAGGQISGGSGSGNLKAGVVQLGSNIADLSLDSGKDSQWEVVSRKNRGAASAPKQWGPQNSSSPSLVSGSSQNSSSASWVAGKAAGGAWQDNKSGGRGITKSQSPNASWEKNYMAPPSKIAPPLQHGWQWGARNGQVQAKAAENVPVQANPAERESLEYDVDYEEDMIEDSDDDIYSDGFDSDDSVKSHETRKQNKWFKKFFDILDKLTLEETNSSIRQWHCPACQNGPGAIDWYKGLQPLMAHAKTKGSKRVKLHREFAELLDEELSRKGTSVVPVGEVYGKWHGLHRSVPDKQIVWPPMVVVMNTQLDQDENEKWIGMGNQELLDYFSAYNAVKARHSYGPKGHRGMSLLVFEGLPTGYVEAERLHNHFVKEGRDRDAWDHRRILFYAGGARKLYGFIANKEDMDNFNLHSPGKSKLKFEMRSYEEMVVTPMKQMSEENQQLLWYKNRLDKNQRHTKGLEESLGIMSERLRKTTKENVIVRERTKLQHEQNKEEMDQQEQFYKAQMEMIHQKLGEKEKNFAEQLQAERTKQLNVVDSKSTEEKLIRNKEIAKFIETQEEGIDQFLAERDSLIKLHEEKKAELKCKHLQEEVDLEKEFDTSLTELMSRHSPQSA
ncbi:hypothetical protein C5167_018262 [Papaver somniferum]|uniref:XS domain-containing protein n=1 Tax=Papaver somniferum TaxID=3469 RepID=A0A4Y7IQT4_PAPSO|nr:protein SUPPRESSOR OF GENE SILENCING 3 homolog [Papaver somniferum]RZC49838.1 hypothetical protein C5167_018262 [Papaver somniferum]